MKKIISKIITKIKTALNIKLTHKDISSENGFDWAMMEEEY